MRAPVARDEQGAWCHWPLAGHLLIAGSTGSGKSSAIRAVATYLCMSPLVALVGLDLKCVELAPFEPRLAALAVERDEAARTLEQVTELITCRKRIAGRWGWRQWPATPRHPYVVVLVDEMAELVGGDGLPRSAQRLVEVAAGNLDRAARLGRALGVFIVGATQRAEASVLTAGLRALFSWRFVMASLDKGSYQLALGLSDLADLEHLMVSLSVAQPGIGLWLEPGSQIRRARAIWWSDEQVAMSVNNGARFNVPLAELVQWATEDAAQLVGAKVESGSTLPGKKAS